MKNLLKYTSDDFCPNINEDKVELSLVDIKDGEYRVCVWGNDDLGLEKDFDNLGEAEYLFELLDRLPDITIEILKENGLDFA
ncbi:MAG: hypothetical protein U9N34_07725 [Candidatus Cloacimonadota bacterium]|nr:hypothetical protein [Candidatus Cloacimonadota bacterium]